MIQIEEGKWVRLRMKYTRRHCCKCGQVEADEFRIVEKGGKRFIEMRGRVLRKGRK